MKRIYLDHRYLLLTDHVSAIPSLECPTFLPKNKTEMEAVLQAFVQDQRCYQLVADDEKRSTRWLKSLLEYRKAAGGVVFNAQGHLLVIRRLDKWDLPKGHLESLESKRQAALREVEEECGIHHLSIDRKLATTWHLYPLRGRMALKKTTWYTMQVPGTPILVPQTKEGITEARWVPLAELEAIAQDTWPSLREIFERYLSPDNPSNNQNQQANPQHPAL